MEILSSWFEDYNENHPHKGLKMKPPREHRRAADKLERRGGDGGVLHKCVSYNLKVPCSLLQGTYLSVFEPPEML
jgi:hypothetical protein